MRERIVGGECASYRKALAVIGEYVNITAPEGNESMTIGGIGQ